MGEHHLSYRKTFAEIHSLDLVAGFTMQESTSEFMGIPGENVLGTGRISGI